MSGPYRIGPTRPALQMCVAVSWMTSIVWQCALGQYGEFLRIDLAYLIAQALLVVWQGVQTFRLYRSVSEEAEP